MNLSILSKINKAGEKCVDKGINTVYNIIRDCLVGIKEDIVVNQNENKVGFIADISKIYNGEKSEITFDFMLPKEECEDEDIVFCTPVRVTGRIYERAAAKNDAECYIRLEMKLYGEYNTHCARCAKDLSKTFDIDAEYGVAKKVSEDSTDYVEAPDGVLDVGELARTVFFLELPTRILCKEDCLGLCPICGCDRNVGTCSCNQNAFARKGLSDLKKLLDNDEEK